MYFGLNHITTPQLELEEFFALSSSLGINSVEIRNDTPDTLATVDASAVRQAALNYGLTIQSINALYPFNAWSAELAGRLHQMADYANDCGARSLVMCPLNEGREVAFETTVAALEKIKPILASRNLTGLVEPLGFPQSSLKQKSTAIDAINAADGRGVFKLVHDTFHHHLAGEKECFPESTGLVHISGVSDTHVSVDDMLDHHRVLVDELDRLGNVAQIKTLVTGGYNGPFSFEPFSPEIQSLKSPELLIRGSMEYLKAAL